MIASASSMPPVPRAGSGPVARTIRLAVRRSFGRRLGVALAALAMFCSAPPSTAATVPSSSASADTSSATVGARALLVLGDSISAEYGLARDSGWVRLLDARLTQQHTPYRIVNASISGETTSGGLARIDELLARVRPAKARAVPGSRR